LFGKGIRAVGSGVATVDDGLVVKVLVMVVLKEDVVDDTTVRVACVIVVVIMVVEFEVVFKTICSGHN
jgi:hypothetical protein